MIISLSQRHLLVKPIISLPKKLGIVFSSIHSSFDNFSVTERKKNSRGLNSRNWGKLPFKLIGIVAIFVAVGILLASNFFSTKSPATTPSVAGIKQDLKVAEARKQSEINRSFSFPVTDGKDNQIGSLEYQIQNAELRDEILVSGSKAFAPQGRDFLVLNLKITNDFNQSIKINSRDYVRLMKNGNTAEKLAPEIHNDPVEVQAISTKLTRVGFSINETDTNLILQIGEIDGDKQEVPIEFK